MKMKICSITGVFLFICALISAQIPDYLKEKEAEVYKLHESEVKLLASQAISDEMARLTLNQHIKDVSKMNNIRTIIGKRETRKATYQFIYPDDEIARYEARQRVTNEFKPFLIRYLFVAGEIVGSYNCRMVMRNKDTLMLSAKQQASIVDTAVELDQLLEKQPNMDSRGYELKSFGKIFNNRQMDLYLSLKLNDEVKGQVAASWIKLKDNQLDYGLDSTIVAAELYRYHMARSKANYLYYNNDALRNAAVESINNSAPLAIRRINAIPAAQKAKAAYNGSFSW